MKRWLVCGWLYLLCGGLLWAGPCRCLRRRPHPRPFRCSLRRSAELERDGDHPWAIFVLTIARSHKEFHLVSTLAQNTIFGLASVPEQVQSLPASMGTPLAAVNGDWFEIQPGPYQGDLINMFIYRGQLVSLPTVGDTFWLDANGQPHVDHVTTTLQVNWPNGTWSPLGLDGAARRLCRGALYPHPGLVDTYHRRT